jgi:hypothetical protein
MSFAAAGSAYRMEHEFTHPARVVEVRAEPPEEDDPTEELMPPAPVATDDGELLREPEARAA